MAQDSIESTLNEIRDLIKSSKKVEEDELLELTEDDLVDESDEDAYYDQRVPKKEENLRAINQILTKISHSNRDDDSGTMQDAGKSLAKLKDLVKKAEYPQVNDSKIALNVNLEDLVKEALKPLLKEWIDTYLPEILEREAKKIIANKKET
jgi:cell pole-organizing protein PopZ